MEPDSFIDPHLLPSDLIVLGRLLDDVQATKSLSLKETTLNRGDALDHGWKSPRTPDSGYRSSEESPQLADHITTKRSLACSAEADGAALDQLYGLTNPEDHRFIPSVFVTWDLQNIGWPPWLRQYVLLPYVRWAQTIVRVPTDVVMLTHLLMYATTTLPSAILLYTHFSYLHGVLHWAMQSWYVGSYTLMMHQHIHAGGILQKKYAIIDTLFPYLTDPLHGHTWNSYYYHHVKHHHVEGNGPGDLSSTIHLQRDSVIDLLRYMGRFMLLIWIELAMYFIRKRQYRAFLKGGISELSNLFFLMYLATQVNFRATLFVFLLPLFVLRAGLMIGNWGQHALVDEVDPDSDFRSSITLIDVPSNRYSFNDGYHTSHHLNPRRHWREHPAAFLKQKKRYADEEALVFRNIDYIMLTFTLLRKDYDYLARCLVPIGEQIQMSRTDIAAMLRMKTRKMSPEQIKEKFGKRHRQ